MASFSPVVESDVDSDQETPSAKRKFSGSATYYCKYTVSWREQYPCIEAVKNDDHSFYCTCCMKKLSCKHMGIGDVKRHVQGASHQKASKDFIKQTKLSFTSPGSSSQKKIERAEVKMSILLAQHNVPLSLADHLSPMIRDVFDGDISKGYACAKTKTSCILNGAVSPLLKNELISAMQQSPFSLCIDGSSDTDLQKMNPITVRIFDLKTNKAGMRFLDMCATSGTNAATAQVIFEKMDSVLSSQSVPWINCVGVGVDSTSVNIGRHNSIMTRVQGINPAIYFMKCPCHIAHNAACYAADAFRSGTSFDVEDFLVDIYFWFDKSSKRKNLLQEYCTFCDTEYRKIIKHVSTRWLSLQRAIERVLKQYNSLRSYFLSESCSEARFVRVNKIFSNPLVEVYLLFFHSILSLFNAFNLLLQREDPCIHLIYDECERLLNKLIGRLVPSIIISAATSVFEVDYLTNQYSDQDVFIGLLAKQTLAKLENEGDCTPNHKKRFYAGVRSFYEAAIKYILEKFPFSDDLLKHSRFLNFDKRSSCLFSDIEYFADRYKNVPTIEATDDLYDEFVSYKLLQKEDIPSIVWESALVKQDDENSHTRIDMIWGHISDMKTGDNCNLQFPSLSAIARLVLTLPHSNAGEERVFSLVRLNKTPYRSCLGIDGTLSSILTVKMNDIEPCYNYEPTQEMLEKSKKATWEYNKQHQKNK
jgi:hypothetical protein